MIGSMRHNSVAYVTFILAVCCSSDATGLYSAFSKKISATTPNFLHVFGRAPSDLQLRFVQLKTRAPSVRDIRLLSIP